MRSLFAQSKVVDLDARVYRNIVSLHHSIDLFADIAPSSAAADIAMRVELLAKPANYRSAQPIIDRPFEEALWASVVQWPFEHWQTSRFCDGQFGVWYGSKTAQTTVHETVHHWYHGLLRDAGFQAMDVYAERKLYSVQLTALALDFSQLAGKFAALVHPSDYAVCQGIGKRVASEGHPALIAASARDTHGINYAVFKPSVLSAPQLAFQVSYQLSGGTVHVEKQPGEPWLSLPMA